MLNSIYKLLLTAFLLFFLVLLSYKIGFIRYFIVYWNEYFILYSFIFCIAIALSYFIYTTFSSKTIFLNIQKTFNTSKFQHIYTLKFLNSDSILFSSIIYFIALALFLVPTFSLFSFYPNDFSFFGIFPRSDGPEFFGGGLQMLYEGHAESFKSARPIIYSFFATFLILSKGNAQVAMILQSLLIGVATLLAAKTISDNFGKVISVLFFFMILGIAWPFTGIFMTEGVGLAFSIISLTLFLLGLKNNNIIIFNFGLLILTIGQNVRAGAMFVIPFIALFSFIHFYYHKKNRLIISLSLPIIAVCFGIAIQMYASYNSFGTTSLGHGNGIYNIYTLVRGEHGWTQHRKDNIPSNEVTWSLIFNEIRTNPENLVTGVIKRGRVFISQTFVNLNRYLLFTSNKSPSIYLFYFLLILSSIYLFCHRRTHTSQFMLIFLLGYILSGPVLGAVAFNRVFVSSAPFIIFFLVLGITTFSKPKTLNNTINLNYSQHFASSIGVLLVAAIILSPYYHNIYSMPKDSIIKKDMRLDVMEVDFIDVRLEPGMSHITVTPDAGKDFSNTFLTLSPGRFDEIQKKIRKEFTPRHLELETFPSVVALTYALNYSKRPLVYLIGGQDLIHSKRFARLHGKTIYQEKHSIFRVESIETL